MNWGQLSSPGQDSRASIEPARGTPWRSSIRIRTWWVLMPKSSGTCGRVMADRMQGDGLRRVPQRFRQCCIPSEVGFLDAVPNCEGTRTHVATGTRATTGHGEGRYRRWPLVTCPSGRVHGDDGILARVQPAGVLGPVRSIPWTAAPPTDERRVGSRAGASIWMHSADPSES